MASGCGLMGNRGLQFSSFLSVQTFLERNTLQLIYILHTPTFHYVPLYPFSPPVRRSLPMKTQTLYIRNPSSSLAPHPPLVQVNEISFENMSNDDAVKALREIVQQPGPITLTVAKCWEPEPVVPHFEPRSTSPHTLLHVEM